MPKKHTPAYTTTKPSYVHPSLQRSPASSSAPTESQTVTQRIQQLRREQAPRATPEQRDELTSAVSSRTVPPELRRILHIPEVNAPKPKTNTRTRRVAGGARPPPGPAAPTSWLQTSRHAPAYMRNKKKASNEQAARFGTLTRVTNEEFKVRHHLSLRRHPRSCIVLPCWLPGLILIRFLTYDSAYHHREASSTNAYEPSRYTGKSSLSMNSTIFPRYRCG
jgi:hypothetical protein